MLLPHVICCGVYKTAEKNRQTIPTRWISFNISGAVKSVVYYPDGTPCPHANPHHSLTLSLGFPGFVTDFEYNANRENWVLQMDFPQLCYDAESHSLYVDSDGSRIPLQRIIRVQPEDLPELRERFLKIAHLAASALISDHLKSDLMTAEIFMRFLPDNATSVSTAHILKERLDRDRSHKFSVYEHCTAMKMNPDYLRRAFLKEFGMTPGVYRERRRKNDILSLFTYSDYSFKEIASRLGLKYVQHLNVLTEKYFHCTPGELHRRFRKMQLPVEVSKIASQQKDKDEN